MDSLIERYKNISLSLPALPSSYITIKHFDEEWQIDSSIHTQQSSSLPFAQSKCHLTPIKSFRSITNRSEDVKPVYEIVFNIEDVPDFSYEPGDTVAILPINSEKEVSFVIKTLGFDHICDKKVTFELTASGSKKKLPNYLPEQTSIRRLIRDCLDLHCIPKKLFLRSLLEFLIDDNEKRVLSILCSKEGSAEYSETIVNGKRRFLDVLSMFRSWKNVPFHLLVEHLSRLLPRPYSIANSPLKDQSELKIWFSVDDPPGITTKMLQDFCREGHDAIRLVPLYLRESNSFRYLEIEDPVILVATGVGVSPFIGFLDHREVIRNVQTGIRVGNADMLYGSRHENENLCRDILKHHLSTGALTDLNEAFSRDVHAKFKYVQDYIEANGSSYIDLLMNDNCKIFVCGSDSMVEDVRKSIQNCLTNFMDYSYTDAVDFIQSLVKSKRYIEDIWR